MGKNSVATDTEAPPDAHLDSALHGKEEDSAAGGNAIPAHNPPEAAPQNAEAGNGRQNNKTNGSAPYRILVISDTFVGTDAFSKDNFVGLAEYFKTGNEQKANLIILFGGYAGLIPWIPLYEQQDQLKSVKQGINFMSMVPAIFKPPFERLMKEMAPHPEVYVLPGVADSENIKAIAKDLRVASTYRRKWLQDELARMEISIKNTAEIIKSTENSIEGHERQLKKHPDDASILSEYEGAKQALLLNGEELADYKERKEIIKSLLEAHVRVLDFKKLKSLTDKLKKELKDEEEKAEGIKNENGTKEEHEKAVARKKTISNLLRVANKRLTELGNLKLESSAKQGPAQIIEGFTHNVRIKPDIEKIVSKLAKANYYSFIEDFGRKYNMVIPDEDLTFIQKKLNGFEFTIAIKAEPTIGTSSRMYSKNSNTVVADNFYTYLETAGRREVLQKPLTMLISGGHAFTSLSMEPTFDLDSQRLLLSLAKGPFADRATVAEMLNKKIVTRANRMAEKLPIDSSASIIDVFPNGEITHTSLTSEFLKIKRIEADKRELEVAQKLIEDKGQKAQKHLNEGSIESEADKLKNKDLEELILQQRLPSELKADDVSKLSTKEILKLIPHAAEKIPDNIKKLGVFAISDVHWGGWAETDVLDKMVELGKKYVHDLDPGRTPIFLLNGDIIEGNLANFKNSPAQFTHPDTNKDYRAWLQKRGFTEEQVNAELLKRVENVSIIQTISAQAASVVERLLPMIDEVMANKNGYIIVTSGNHFNNTSRMHEHDEATEISGNIGFYLKGKGFSEGHIKEHVKVIIGEEYGIGNIPVDDDNLIRTQHKLARVLEQKPQVVVKKRVPVASVFESHYHEAKMTVSGDLQTFETPAMQYEDENTYVLEFPQAISDATRGAVIVEVDLKDNKTIKSTYKPILRANLERSGELERSLYQAFRKESFSIKTQEAPKEAALVLTNT